MKRCLTLMFASIALLATVPGHAQSLANKQVTMVVAFPAGGAVDAMARILSQQLGQRLGTTVIVENKPGFAGNIGAQYVAKGPADGTLLMMAPISSYAISEAVHGKATGWNMEEQFVNVIAAGQMPFVMITPPTAPATTVKDYVVAAKGKAAGVTFANSGNGTTEQILAEIFRQKAGINAVHVPYKGGAPAVTGVMGGETDTMFATIPNVIGNYRAGKVKALAVTTPNRHPELPDVPTMAESGYPDLTLLSNYSVMAPAQTPPDVLALLNRELAAILATPEARQKIAALGVVPTTSTLDEARTQMKTDIVRYRDVVRAANIKPN